MLKLKLKKWIGSWYGIWCPECGDRLVSTGYDDKEKCTNLLCIKMYGITNVEVIKKKRGRPKKV